MTKETKRLVAFIAAAMLLIGMIVPVMASSQPHTGTITVHKYVRNSAAVPHSDNQFSGEKLTGPQLEGLGTPTNGVGFTLWNLNMAPINSKLNTGAKITGYTVQGTIAGNDLSVLFHFDDGTDVNSARQGNNYGEQFTSTVDGVDGVIVWSGPPTGDIRLFDGFYLLGETTPLPGYAPAELSVIKLPLTKADGTGLNRDVHVYPKNISTNATVITKEVDGTIDVLATGDVVPFKITTLFQNDIAAGDTKVAGVEDLKKTNSDGTNYGKIAIIDNLEDYFKQVNSTTTPITGNDVEVYLVDGSGNRITGTTLTADVDYTLTQTPGTAGETVRVDLTNDGIDKAIAATPRATGIVMAFDAQYVGGATAGIENTTITNIGNAIILGALPAQPGPDPTPTPTQPPGEPTPPPSSLFFPKAQVEIRKFDETGATPLVGATFALAKVAAPAKNFDAAEWDAADAAGKATLAAAYAPMYVCDVNGRPITATSTATGKIFFNDVPYADAAISYYAKELSTAEGYEIPTGTTQVSFLAKSGYSALQDAQGNWMEGAVISALTTINNYPEGTDKSFSLPLTGGTGTMLLTIAGIALMSGAVAIYLKGRKAKA